MGQRSFAHYAMVRALLFEISLSLTSELSLPALPA